MVTSSTPKVMTVIVTYGNSLVERGEFFTNGDGLVINIEDRNLWNLVNIACLFLLDEPAAISATLENGWEVSLLRKITPKGRLVN